MQMKNRMALVMASSRIYLFAAWAVAIASVPSFRSYQDQLDAGTDPKQIVTVYSSIKIMIFISSLGAWIYTSAWLKAAVTDANAAQPGSVRLQRGWALWGWVVPIVSYWFPRMIIKDLLKTKPVEQVDKSINLNTWWLTWLMYALIQSSAEATQIINDYLGNKPVNPIHPEMEIAGACLLTASYFVWQKIVAAIGEPVAR